MLPKTHTKFIFSLLGTLVQQFLQLFSFLLYICIRILTPHNTFLPLYLLQLRNQHKSVLVLRMDI